MTSGGPAAVYAWERPGAPDLFGGTVVLPPARAPAPDRERALVGAELEALADSTGWPTRCFVGASDPEPHDRVLPEVWADWDASEDGSDVASLPAARTQLPCCAVPDRREPLWSDGVRRRKEVELERARLLGAGPLRASPRSGRRTARGSEARSRGLSDAGRPLLSR